ncbi:hypothetical protein KMW28_17070 [Flammeovirga yaeyamensis]|uniref:Uncharacterized protein n=1 Tax=Flammeovirga yaeyamensis TaxID=367791 RepID=A0AAX1N1Z8_9BACT|nr:MULTISPECIES: hypothetical protein [Flammeovirga]ANQ51215.1 hypothetical protein MY04_3871 [Flammeovirga sp. MY04]MBB3698270.1 hypothetical protein [Flammeovirga yaeyamensis]NMF34375.1 hypothetical protein [Flammeovirga yaeyamensis]QWG01356.1 hypothetical protein KMW28_17070 [Flammeovirga yaeyamensis]
MQRLESSIKNLLNQSQTKPLSGLCPYHRQRISKSSQDALSEVKEILMTFVTGEMDRFKKQIPEESKGKIQEIAEQYVLSVLNVIEENMMNGGEHYNTEELINGAVRIFNVEDCPVFHTK